MSVIDSAEYYVARIKHEGIKVDFVNLNEGVNGDFDPSDPDDTHLIRVDVYLPDGDEASSCTSIEYGHPDVDYDALVEKAWGVAKQMHTDGRPAKTITAAISWWEAGHLASPIDDTYGAYGTRASTHSTNTKTARGE